MKDEQFGKMVKITSNAFIIRKACEMKKLFNARFQKKKNIKR